MAGAFHGAGEGEVVLNVGVSGPGVVLSALKRYPDVDLGGVSDVIKKTAFKITRAGELIGRVVAERLGVPFGIMDLSLAPTNAQNDSVAEILEEIGLERVGTHGTIAALAPPIKSTPKSLAARSNVLASVTACSRVALPRISATGVMEIRLLIIGIPYSEETCSATCFKFLA